MNISKLNSCMSFGKKPLMTCVVQESKNTAKHSATLYKMDPNNSEDCKDIFYSHQAHGLFNDFIKSTLNPLSSREFYLLQNDETGEVVSCAETSLRYRPFEYSHSGKYTLIEEAKQNAKYKDGAEPLFAFITKQAGKRFNASVFTAFNENTFEGLKKFKFSKVKTGEYYIPEKRFPVLIKSAEKKYKMEYLDRMI